MRRLEEAAGALLASSELAAGWWCGVAGLVIGLAAVSVQRARQPTPIPVIGLLFGAAIVIALAWTLEAPVGLAVGLLALVGAGAVGGSVRGLPLALPVAVAGAWLVMFGSGLTLDGWLRLLAVTAVAVGGWLTADFDQRWRSRGLGPVLLAVSVAGVYVTVPDTEQALIALGAVLPLTLLGWPWPVASLGPGGAYAAVGAFVWVVAAGGVGRSSSVVGGIACLGLLVVEPLARRLSPGRRSLLESLPGGRWGVLAVIVVHLWLVYVAARVAGLQPTVASAAGIAAMEIAVAVGIAVTVTDLHARRGHRGYARPRSGPMSRQRFPLRQPNEVSLFGVLVTHRRPADLCVMLQRLSEQEKQPTYLVVVDNAPSPETRQIVERHEGALPLKYLAAPENLGPAGGIALGMEHVLAHAGTDDWIVLLDDDDPPEWPSALANLLSFGEAMRQADERTAGVGLAGARFDRSQGRLIRPRDEELTGPVAIDYIGGNQLPLYLAGVVREVGPFDAPLFFGFEELEYGLRLRQAGYSLYAPGPVWLEQRRRQGRVSLVVRPDLRLDEPSWRHYYSLRNLIYILRKFGETNAAARVTAVRGLMKPMANLVRTPGRAWRRLNLNILACRDGWMGRLGRTIEPEAGSTADVSMRTEVHGRS